MQSINPETNSNQVPPNETSSEENYFFFKLPCKPIDLTWDDITIQATIKKINIEGGKKKKIQEKKIILNNVSGTVKHGTFTAIMGPSGSGKTVLLNFLSGRMESRLKLQGKLFLNSKPIYDMAEYASLVAFVPQDDILFSTISPQRIFYFSCQAPTKSLSS